MHDVLQVFHRAVKAIAAANDQGVTGLHEVEQHLQLGSPVAAGTACLLGAHDTAADRLKGRTLDREILVEGADICVAVRSHLVPKGSRRRNATVPEYPNNPNGMLEAFHARMPPAAVRWSRHISTPPLTFGPASA